MHRLTAALLTLALAGTPERAAAEQAPVTLRVKPVLCITDRDSRSCDVSFIVFWESDNIGHYCLYNDFSSAPLDCWEEESSGEVEDHRIVARSFSYWLTGRNAGVRLAEATVEVMTTESTDRRRKRRHRHVWNIL